MDKTKEELTCLRTVFALFFVTDVSLLGWLAQSYDATKPILLAVASLLAVSLMAAIAWLGFAMLKRLSRLED